MLKAMKGKRVIRIPTDKKDSYIALGYSITDMEGNMIYNSAGKSQKNFQGKKYRSSFGCKNVCGREVDPAMQGETYD